MEPGTLFAERFEIEREAGRGGMGTVYRARDRLDGAAVAVKLVHGATVDDAPRFLREGRVLAELRHPGIVRYVAHGVAPSGELYLAMEWLDGEDLAARLARALPSIAESLDLARRIAEVLGIAHAKGIVHRDVKPSNVFLADGRLDRVKLLDFGVARVVGGTHATQTGAMLGTPAYMAPEQARGDRAVDARADVFALGCVLFECLTGQPPFRGDHVMAVLAKILLEEAPRLSDVRTGVPEVIEDLVGRMLAKEPGGRPKGGAAVAREIEALGAIDEVPFTPSSPPPAALTTGEKKLLSVVLLGAAPARDAHRTLLPSEDESPLVTLHATAQAYGARLERLAGGNLVATLLGSGAATDQAARAARLALAMNAVLRDRPIALVVGLGEVAGRWPVGESVERSAAVLRGATGEGVRLDEATAGLLGGRFDVRRDGEGILLLGERVSEATRTLLGKETPCVGRDRELSVLEGLFAECRAEPAARPVLVVAAPGVGKSRVRYELVRRLRESQDVEIWMGSGDALSAGSPFGLLGRALRAACGIQGAEPLAVRRSKLRARVARHVAAPDHQRVTEFVGELCGVSFPDDESVPLRAARQSPIVMGDQMRRAWEDFLLAETAVRPVVLVLEDLHWGDLPTVGFVDAALRNLRDSPLFVVATARPEVYDLFPKLWAERRLQEIRLDELSKRAGEKLVKAALPQATQGTVARLVDRAAGNAFFLEELVRAEAHDAGADTPGSVLAMVQARLESLPPEARRVLRAASVFGVVSWKGGVAALLGGDERDASEWLTLLVDREILFRRGEGRFPGEEEFGFRHALVRDAAYDAFTDADRVLGHRLAGDWLQRAGETDAVVLAEHFERGQEPARAVDSWRRAAGDALEGNDFAGCIARADRGIACGAAGEPLGALRLLQAEAHRWNGAYPDAERAARGAVLALPEGSDPWFAAQGEIAVASGHLGLHDALEQLGRSLLDGSPGVAWVGAAARAATQLFHAGRHELAEQLVLRTEERLPDAARLAPAFAAWAEFAGALQCSFAGDVGGYLRRCQAAAERAEQAGDLRYSCLMRQNAGFALMEVGANEEAVAALSAVIPQAERLGVSQFVAAAKHNLGLALSRVGRIVEGAALESEAALAFADRMPRMECLSLAYLAAIHLAGDDAHAALKEATAAAALLDGAPALAPLVLGTRAQALLALGRTDEACAAAQDAVRRLDALGGVNEGESRARLALAEALHAAGDLARARAALALARERLEARAAKIRDEALRRSFLDGVPENARTLALAR